MSGEKVELLSEEVQDILGQIPHWIIRWGITVIFMTIIILVIGSYFFRYPDVLTSSIMVTTENPPASIIARSQGKLEIIWVNDQDTVREDQILALINNPMNFDHYIILLKKTDSLTNFINDIDSIKPFILPDSLILGEVQASYNDFLSKYEEYFYSIDLDYHNKKIEVLNEKIKKHNLYYSRLWEQRNILEEELKLARNQYERDRKLFDKGIMSKAEFEKSESKMLQKNFDFEQSRANLATTKMQLQEIEQQILELKLESSNHYQEQKMMLKEYFNKLKNDINTWEHNYLLKSPMNGIVSFTKYWSVNQNVIAGDKVFTIVPEDSSRITGRITLPIQGSGKVAIGQKVNIKFESYPYMEYGMVGGVIKSISLVPENNFLIAEVDFPDALITNYGKEIVFTQEMQGIAEIITEEVRLLEKLFNPIRSIFKKQSFNKPNQAQ